MTITVLLAVKDLAALLPETLASLDAQTDRGFDVVALDDGSSDGTGDVLRRFAAARPVRVVRTEGIGLAAARNRAMEMADGPLLMTLDGDDVLAPTLVADLRAALDGAPGADMAFALCDHVGPDGARLGYRSPIPVRPLTAEAMLRQSPVHTDSGVLFRRAAARAAGGFDAALTGYVGLDFWGRLAARNPDGVVCVERPLVLYRRRPGQITASAARMERNLARLLSGADGLDAAARARVLASHRLFWASVAYADGDLAGARRYTWAAWRAAPAAMARSRYAYARAAISAASLLPRGIHDRLADGARAAMARRDAS